MNASIRTKATSKTVHIADASLRMPTLCGQSPSAMELDFQVVSAPATCKRCIKSATAEGKWA